MPSLKPVAMVTFLAPQNYQRAQDQNSKIKPLMMPRACISKTVSKTSENLTYKTGYSIRKEVGSQRIQTETQVICALNHCQGPRQKRLVVDNDTH